jgi:catechol 2,3-dioxygenase-like lactoylglutathione lyase family enzyme
LRDPEGHPLELLAFANDAAPPLRRAVRDGNPCLGIDHSAISVADTLRSVDFYEQLGFTVAARSRNCGLEQERLDAVREPHVEITALAPPRVSPHVELLCYRGVQRGRTDVLRSNDIAATRLVLEMEGHEPQDAGAMPCSLVDPDGHRLALVAFHEHGRQ